MLFKNTYIPSGNISSTAPSALIVALSLVGLEKIYIIDHWCLQQTQTQFVSSNDNSH